MDSSSTSSSVVSAHRAVSGVVRLLAEVRLAVLVLVVVSAMDRPMAVLGVLLIAPFSYVPARSWEKHGQRIARSGILLACDLVATVLVTLLVPGLLGWVYALATAALVGVVVGWRLALVVMSPVALLVLPIADPGDVHGWVAGAAVAATVVAMSFTGDNLGAALRRQWLAAETSSRLGVAQAATSERVRIARDMHDTVAGDLAGAILMAQVLRDRLATEKVSAPVRDIADQMVDLCTTAHKHTREAIGELRRAGYHPMAELGDLCTEWSARAGVSCSLDLAPEVDDLDQQLFADLKAMLTELLENVRRHSGARRATVEVKISNAEITLSVTDDGRGMRGVQRRQLTADGHFGLAGIDERAAGRGGSVTRDEAVGGGLRTVVRLPFSVLKEMTA